MEGNERKKFSIAELLLPFGISVPILSISSYVYGDSAGKGLYQVALLLGAVVALMIGQRKGLPWDTVKKSFHSNIKPVFPTLVFLLLIGAISVIWLFSGIIPTAIYYGLHVLHPKAFLPLVMFSCSMMSLACGSSWLAVGTMGVSFIGIGNLLGFPSAIVAGAIISGAYFGDKISPLSETTILASSMTKTPLLTHVRYMMWTSIPAFLLAFVLFLVGGFWYTYGLEISPSTLDSNEMKEVLEELFAIRFLFLLVPGAIIIFTMLGFSPLKVLGAGCLCSVVIAWYWQREFLDEIGDKHYETGWDYFVLLCSKSLLGMRYSPNEGFISNLLTSEGIVGMWPTITIILAATTFGSAMESTGILNALMTRVVDVSSRGKLITLAIVVSIFLNITIADQCLAIILTCKMFSPLFKKQHLSSENVSRTAEDAATVTSPLVPWNTCGSTQARVLGIPTLSYLPFSFFNILSPIFGILFGVLGIKIATATSTISSLPTSKKKKPKRKFIRIR